MDFVAVLSLQELKVRGDAAMAASRMIIEELHENLVLAATIRENVFVQCSDSLFELQPASAGDRAQRGIAVLQPGGNSDIFTSCAVPRPTL